VLCWLACLQEQQRCCDHQRRHVQCALCTKLCPSTVLSCCCSCRDASQPAQASPSSTSEPVYAWTRLVQLLPKVSDTKDGKQRMEGRVRISVGKV
jgi:hypothetical protein